MNKDVFKLPNVLSLLRILFSVVLYLLFMQHYRGNIEVSPLLIFFLYVVIALTDLVDGVIARRMGTVTELGKELDPMADKVLVFLILFAFFRIHILPLWVILPVFLRDIFVHSLRRRARMLELSFKTSGPAKAKTAVQMLFIGFVLAIPADPVHAGLRKAVQFTGGLHDRLRDRYQHVHYHAFYGLHRDRLLY
ncbi:MAG: CDP-alcohol phosphatidyltransferase family protein [Candidatus Marinimicrobia bacterium]|nr:CDP-alcohol phosphatidyltransferase family protein [Candidatus Neomarinimicrobiota bacterium]